MLPTIRRWGPRIGLMLAVCTSATHATAPGESCENATALYERTFLPHVPQKLENGIGYRIGEDLVDFSRDRALAPLDRIQREFERVLADEVKARPFHPPPPPRAADPNDVPLETSVDAPPQPPPPPPGTNVLGLGFDAHRAGAFASLRAEWNFGFGGEKEGLVLSHSRQWLLHVPTGRVVAFDDLFVHPGTARQRLVERIPVYLTTRWESMTVHGDTAEKRREEEARVTAAVARVMALDPDQWFVGLDLANPCQPGIAIQLGSEGAWADFQEWPTVRIAPESVSDQLKPEYLEAFRAASAP
jgi:hypothetical protein